MSEQQRSLMKKKKEKLMKNLINQIDYFGFIINKNKFYFLIYIYVIYLKKKYKKKYVYYKQHIPIFV